MSSTSVPPYLPPPPFWRTRYFALDVMPRRPYLQDLTQGDVDRIMAAPDRREREKTSGRTRYWGYAPGIGRYIRLVIEPDGRTIMNAFEDT